MRRSWWTLLVLLVAAVTSVAGQGSGGGQITVRNLRVNPVSGLIQADVTVAQAPIPVRVDVRFELGSEVANGSIIGGFALNTPRTVSSTQPFPCNATREVRAVITSAVGAGTAATAMLTRRCSQIQGTPDLRIARIERIASVPGEVPGLRSAPQTPIRISVFVINDSNYNMSNNESGGTPFSVQVTPGAAARQTIRRALLGAPDARRRESNGERLTFDIALPCGRTSAVTAQVDVANVIREANENNNTLTAQIPGNSCGNP